MPNIFVKKTFVITTAAASGTANFLSRITAGFVLTTSVVLKMAQTMGTVLTQSPITLRIAETVGLVFTNKSVYTTAKPIGIPGGRIVQTKVDLVQTVNATSVVQTAVGGRSDWALISSSTGVPDSDNGLPPTTPTNCANIAGSLLTAIGGRLDLSYAATAGKTTLTITKVELLFYVRQNGTALNNGNLITQWSKGGAPITLQTITGDVNNIGTPIIYDITASIATWAEIDLIKTYASFSVASTNLTTANVDAVQRRVTATLTTPQ